MELSPKLNEKDNRGELSNSQKLRDLIKSRDTDDINTVYNHDIAEIYLSFNGREMSLRIKDISDSYPPIFTMDSITDILIECEEMEKFELTEDMLICIRYEEKSKYFSLGNIIDKTRKDNELDYPRYIAPLSIHPELDISLDIYYDNIKKGLTHPVLKLYFSEQFWEEFKEYPQYLL